MAMSAMDPNERAELLKALSADLPDVDDSLLQELAENFGLDTLACFDFVDFQAVLDVPGKKSVHRGVVHGSADQEFSLNKLFPAASANDLDWETASAALLVIKTGAKDWQALFSRLWTLVGQALHPDAIFGGPVHFDRSLGGETHVLLVLSGEGGPP